MRKKKDKLAKLLQKKRWNKKDDERIKRLLAEIESKARSESEKRQERIKVLEQELLSGRLAPKDKELAETDLVRSLLELVVLHKDEIEYLRPFRRELERIRDYDSKQLEHLSFMSVVKLMQPGFQEQLAEEEPKKVYECKRSRRHRDFRSSIEYQFGGGLEAEFRRRMPFLALGPYDPRYLPVCLDDIFAGDGVSMLKLEELFQMERHRFPKELPYRREGTKTVYGWEAVVQIMDFLLGETGDFLLQKQRRKRKQPVRGASKKLWLYDEKDPDLQSRVLKGIKTRLNSFPVRKGIKARFLKVVHDHLPDSGKK